MPSIKEIYNSIGEVELNADSINLNVDGLEALASTQQADIALIKADVDDIRADLANGVTINQPVAVTDNGGSVTVDGTVTANLPTSGAYGGNLQGYNGTNTFLNVGIQNIGGTGLDGASSLPISGTVTANSGTGTFQVSDRGGAPTVSSFSNTASSTLKASEGYRKLLTIFNEGAGTLYVLYGSGTASTTNYSVRLNAGDYLEIEKYTGQVNAIFATSGTARVTEIT